MCEERLATREAAEHRGLACTYASTRTGGSALTSTVTSTVTLLPQYVQYSVL